MIVNVERAGDVIPHVVSVDLNKREKNSKKFIFQNVHHVELKLLKNLMKLQKKKML